MNKVLSISALILCLCFCSCNNEPKQTLANTKWVCENEMLGSTFHRVLEFTSDSEVQFYLLYNGSVDSDKTCKFTYTYDGTNITFGNNVCYNYIYQTATISGSLLTVKAQEQEFGAHIEYTFIKQ